MSDLATITGPLARGMITIRADFSAEKSRMAIAGVTGCDVPGIRRVESGGGWQLLWMSPDELLAVGPFEGADALCSALSDALAGSHALVANVSDARAVFALAGNARDVLARLCPVDLHPDVFGVGQVRRTRAGQVPVAFWPGAEGWTLVCFRSVSDYVADLLRNAARSGNAAPVFNPE